MSMIGKFRAVRPRVLDALASDPTIARLVSMYSPTQPAFVPDSTALANLPPEFRAAVEASAAQQSGLSGSAGAHRLTSVGLSPDDLADPFSLDKAWHGVHFLLARTVYEPTVPPGDAVLGGVPFGEDLGYGPLRVKTVEQVATTSAALSALDRELLRNSVAPSELAVAEIYPGGWDSGETTVDWILDALATLRDFYARTTDSGDAMLLFIS